MALTAGLYWKFLFPYYDHNPPKIVYGQVLTGIIVFIHPFQLANELLKLENAYLIHFSPSELEFELEFENDGNP